MEYDDIVVGAGSAGAVLAARLSEDPGRSVLLLEAGPDYPAVEQTPTHLLDSRAVNLEGHDWSFSAEVVPGRMAEYPRGKVTGGSSAINAAMALRGVPADYDEWAALGNDQWSWRHVLPWFCRLEDDQDAHGDLHGSGGPIPVRRTPLDELQPTQRAFLDACRALGFPLVDDHNHPDSTGVGPGPMNVRDGVRVSTAIGYLLPARHRLNLTIRPYCLVHRVLLAPQRGSDGVPAVPRPRAVGVEVECGGEVQPVFGRRVTLAAGAVCSPAILLRSGVGPKEHLIALEIEPLVDLPAVGENLIDHPQVGFNLEAKAGVLDASSRMWQVMLRYTAPGSAEFNDMQTYMFHWPPATTRLNAIVQRPRSRGRLGLTSSDPHVQPAIMLRLAQDPEDGRRLREGVRIAWRVAQSPQVSALHEPGVMLDDGTALRPDDAERFFSRDEALESYILRTVNHFVHPVGSVRMGADGDVGAVVDQYCRVRGIDNLRVVDASVMPAIPRANTNLTCIMIGERVADWMRAEASPGGSQTRLADRQGR